MNSSKRLAAQALAPRSAGMSVTSSTPANSIFLIVQSGDGQQQRLEFADMSEAEALRRACARDLRVLAVEAAVQKTVDSSAGKGAFPLVLFSQELLALLDADQLTAAANDRS